tara:strand:+ start:28904 stop:29641 length:738 start_codon:yes stop_codon:yes gene_type:complete
MLCLAACLFSSKTVQSQTVDTIRIGDQFKNFELFEEGSTKYIIYSEFKGITRMGGLMESTMKRVIHEGQNYLAVEHYFYGADKKSSGNFYSLVEPKTFRPIIHIRNSENKGKEAYRFTEKALIALDTVKNNSEEGYHLDLEEPIFNFELDLETFSMLPLSAGYKAVLQFHHPGSTVSAPAWYEIKVEDAEKITIPGNKELDTWVLFMDYNGTQPTRFWYTKGDQKFIKMEGNYNGVKIYKTRVFD